MSEHEHRHLIPTPADDIIHERAEEGEIFHGSVDVYGVHFDCAANLQLAFRHDDQGAPAAAMILVWRGPHGLHVPMPVRGLRGLAQQLTSTADLIEQAAQAAADAALAKAAGK